MSGSSWAAAIGLLLVIEGLLPFAAPAVWRNGIQSVMQLRDGQLRFLGAAAMAAGIVLLVFLN